MFTKVAIIYFSEKDKVGSIREAYHYAANYLGYNKNEADIVYSSVDISLSGYGIFSKSLRPDSWRLFKHINNDYIIGWKKLGTVPLGTEVFQCHNRLWNLQINR